MRSHLNKLRFLDGEKLFKKWTDMGKAGSLRLLIKYAESQGWKNPNTGRPPSNMAVWNSMWRWAVKNEELAKPLYKDYALQFGIFLSDDDWWELMEYRARKLLPPGGYRKYMNKHPEIKDWYEKNRSRLTK